MVFGHTERILDNQTLLDYSTCTIICLGIEMGIDKLGMNKLQLHKGNIHLDTPNGTKKEAVHQFESYLVQMMVREMRSFVSMDSLIRQHQEIFTS